MILIMGIKELLVKRSEKERFDLFMRYAFAYRKPYACFRRPYPELIKLYGEYLVHTSIKIAYWSHVITRSGEGKLYHFEKALSDYLGVDVETLKSIVDEDVDQLYADWSKEYSDELQEV